MTSKWTKVALKGRSQVIPAICPNCLGPAELKFRYGYRGIEGWLTRTTYYQTFTYCQACHGQAVAAAGLRRWGFFAGVAAFFAWIPLMVLLVDLARNPETGTAAGLRGDLALAASVLGALACFALIYLTARLIKRRSHPLRPGQAAWGLAAFYTGGTALGFNPTNAVYRALRPEWIAALVRANPDQVDDAVYHAWTGSTRPSPAVSAHPISPA